MLDHSHSYMLPSSVPYHVSSHYLGVAALTLFGYDIFLTLDDEIKYLWRGSSFTWTDILYFLNRYYSLSVMVLNTFAILLPAPSVKFCLFATRWSGLGSVLVKVPLDIWLLIKIYAMWNCNRKVLTFLLTLLVGNVVGSLTYQLLIYRRFILIYIPTSQRLPGNTGCAVFHAGGRFWVIFALSLTYELVIVIFTIVWAILQFRDGLARRHSPLANSLYKTGVIYFAIMASVMAFMSATGITPLNKVILPSQLLCAMVSTIGARTMLSIHKVHLCENHLSVPSDLMTSDISIRVGSPSPTPVPCHSIV